MDAARWERIQELFHRATDTPEADRRRLLDPECADDPELLAEVLSLLEEDARGGSVLDGGVARVAGRVLEGDSALPPGDAFGPYRIVRVLGEGGMGVVYLAERHDLGSVAAIKILRDASLSPARRERFLSEQRTLAQLEHPSIARLFDAGTLPDGTPWFVMEYVEGVPLTEYCRARRTSAPGRIQLFRAVCEAVQHAHRHAVIHRDLKPSNIYVKADGTIKLLDFGIAKQLDEVGESVEQTQTGLRLLTPAYAAPEQIRGERVGIHTDVYSLGVVLYELLAGRLPFDLSRCTPAEALAIVAQRNPERPSDLARASTTREGGAAARPIARSAWADLDVLCLTAMHKDPQRRYRTVDALIRDLDHFLAGEPLEARPDTMGYRLGKFVRRHRGAVLAGAAAAALVVGLVGFYTVRLAEQRGQARAEAAKATQVSEYLIGLFEATDPFSADTGPLDAATLLARGAERAEALAGQPAVQAELFDVLGRVHVRLSQYEQAEPLLRRALALRRTERDGALDVASTLMNLSDLYRFSGGYDSAAAFAREALALRERGLPSPHADLASTLDGLGIVLSNQGDYAEATAIQRRALAMRRELYQGPHELLSHSLNNLAVTLANQGDYGTAERYLRESIANGSAALGPEHPSLASDLSNLGVVLEIQGNLAAADSALSAALKIKRARLGDLHYETALSLTQLGGTVRRLGDYDRAEAYLREALAIERRILAPNHRNTAVTRTHLAALLQNRGDYAGADSLYRQAARILEESLGARHQFTATTRCALAHLLTQKGERAEAESLFRGCLAILEEALPADHDVLAIQRSRFGGLLTALGRHADAEPLLVDAYQKLRDRFGVEHDDTRQTARRVVALYVAWNRPDDAEAYRREAHLEADGATPSR